MVFSQRMTEIPRSVRLDARELDNLGPLLGFLGYGLAEVGGEPGSTVLPRSAGRALMLGRRARH
jgi:hypothetical protein